MEPAKEQTTLLCRDVSGVDRSARLNEKNTTKRMREAKNINVWCLRKDFVSTHGRTFYQDSSLSQLKLEMNVGVIVYLAEISLGIGIKTLACTRMRTYLILQMYIHISHQCHVRQDTGHTPCSAAVCVRRHTHVWTYETLTEYTAVWPRLDDSHWADMWGPCHYSHADIQPCNEHTHRYIYVCVCAVDGADGVHILLHLPSHHALRCDWWVMRWRGLQHSLRRAICSCHRVGKKVEGAKIWRSHACLNTYDTSCTRLTRVQTRLVGNLLNPHMGELSAGEKVHHDHHETLRK